MHFAEENIFKQFSMAVHSGMSKRSSAVREQFETFFSF